MRCKKCGMELADNAAFCIACGTTVNDKEKSVESVEEKPLTPAAMNAQEQPPELSPRGDKEKLFTAGLLTMIFLYVKDNDLDKDLNALKKAWNKGILKKEILSRMEVNPDFADVLDKSDLFQSCYEIFLTCYDQGQVSKTSVMGKLKGALKGSPKVKLSEAAVIRKLKEMTQGASQADHRYVIDMILIMAFADKVITDKEKEGMGQLIRHLGISDSLFNEMFSAKEAEVTAEVKQLKRRRFWKLCTASVLIVSLIIAGIFFAKKGRQAADSDRKGTQTVSTSQKTGETGIPEGKVSVRVSSFKVSRKNKKNVFPMRRLFPFYADLILESPDLNEGQRRKLCSLIMSPSHGFTIKKSSVTKYEAGKLTIEIEAQSKNLGNQPFTIAMKEDPAFAFEGKAEIPMRFQERITGCSEYLESRFDPAKEFESGQGFAECVNNWMITPEIQKNPDLSKNEGEILQRDFDAFIRDFMKAEDRPKNPFNWFTGVLSVRAKEGYIPYLSIFQKACLAYLKTIITHDSPLVMYFMGMNQNVSLEYGEVSKNPDCLITTAGIEEIYKTDFLRIKKMFREISVSKENTFYKGNWTNNNGIYQFEDKKLSDADPLWIYDHEKLTVSPREYLYKITDTNGLDSDLCTILFGHFPGHSLGSMRISKGEFSCEKYGASGVDFWELFNQRDVTNEDIVAMGKFVHHNLIMDKYNPREDPYNNLEGEVHLLGLWVYQNNNHLFFQYLVQTRMENGQVNLLVPKSELENLFMGGYLIYGYDIENKKFGVVLDLSQPTYEGLYVKAHGYFLPLD